MVRMSLRQRFVRWVYYTSPLDSRAEHWANVWMYHNGPDDWVRNLRP